MHLKLNFELCVSSNLMLALEAKLKLKVDWALSAAKLLLFEWFGLKISYFLVIYSNDKF
jgi:hypothetical protein